MSRVVAAHIAQNDALSRVFPRVCDVTQGSLVLVNRANPVRSAPGPDALAYVDGPGGEKIGLVPQAAAALRTLLWRLGAGGRVLPVSGWRSHAGQRAIYRDALREHGAEYAATYVAWPGCSEHESGLAVDMALMGGKVHPVTPAFPYEGVCQRFRELAPEHGFILRYPAGAERETGIGHEPWHFRYVGAPHAELVTRMGLTLEGYTELLRHCPLERGGCVCEAGGRRWRVGWLPEGAAPAYMAQALPRAEAGAVLSGNNVDGLVAALPLDGGSL